MSAPKLLDNRRSKRRLINRMAKIKVANGALPRDCLITDISEGGVRLHAEGLDVPTDFVLILSGEDMAGIEGAYRVVWRLGHEIGARLIGIIQRNSNFARR